MTKDEEARLRAVERFVSEVRGGRKLLLWMCSVVGAGLAVLVAWLFGGAPS